MGVKKTKQRRTCTYQQYIEFSKSRFLATHHPDIYGVLNQTVYFIYLLKKTICWAVWWSRSVKQHSGMKKLKVQVSLKGT